MQIFIPHQSHRSSENNPERNWHYCEASSSTNGCCGPKQRSYYQPAPYNELQQYFHNRTTLKCSSINVHDRGKLDHQSSIHSVIPTPYKKHAQVIHLGTEQQYLKNSP